MKQVRSIIFVFLVFTIVSSLLSSASFVTGNNLAFATSKKKDDSSGGGDDGSKAKGSGSGSVDNGGGGGGSDTGSTSTPPSTIEETTAPPSAEENTAAPPPPAAENQQTTCPDGSTPDENGKCPTTTLAPNQSPPAAQDGGHILVTPNPDGSCPAGSHKFPGSQVCEKDTATTTPSSGGGQVPPECQGIIAGPSDKCSLGTTGSPTSPINAPPLTPQQQYENCLKGIGGGIPGNCKPPTSTEQKLAPLQTLAPQQTCKDGSTPDAKGICQDGSTPQQTCKGNEVLTDKGNCVSPGESQAIKNGTLVDIGNGKFELGTRPPVPNTNTISPTCPLDSHLVGSKCVVNGAGCPPGTLQDDGAITCSPFKQVQVPVNTDGSCPTGSYSVGSSGNAGQPGTGSITCLKNVRVEAPCDQPDFIRFHGICYQGKETVPNPDGSCPPTTPILFESRCLDKLPVIPGSSTGTGGGFIQMLPVKPDGSIGTSGPVVVYVPANKDGTCPPGDEPASGGYCRHRIQSTPPATPPTNTPPVQPQPPQQLAPSQPECVPGFHWDNAQLKCVAG